MAKKKVPQQQPAGQNDGVQSQTLDEKVGARSHRAVQPTIVRYQGDAASQASPSGDNPKQQTSEPVRFGKSGRNDSHGVPGADARPNPGMDYDGNSWWKDEHRPANFRKA